MDYPDELKIKMDRNAARRHAIASGSKEWQDRFDEATFKYLSGDSDWKNPLQNKEIGKDNLNGI